MNDNQIRLRGGSDGNHWLGYHSGGGFDGAKLYGLQTVALQTVNMEMVLRDGRVGINTASPSKGILHVAGNRLDWSNGGNFMDGSHCNDCGTYDYGGQNLNISIYAENDIVAGWKVLTESDARIKNIQRISNAAQDLETLTGIQITDYTMKDQLRSGKTEYKKVIAQQVESVYPLAVGTTSNFIPDIYAYAAIENGKLSMKTELKVDDEVKLFINDSEERIARVISNKDGLTVLDIEHTGEIFVYGKRVDDFKVVDYDALAMLNISATQELFKLITKLQSDNQELKDKLSDYSSLRSDVELLKEAMGIDMQSAK